MNGVDVGATGAEQQCKQEAAAPVVTVRKTKGHMTRNLNRFFFF